MILCFTGHILGDYYLQSERSADNKNDKFLSLVCHALIYSLPFTVIFLVFGFSPQLGFLFIPICVLHFIIDFIKFIFYKSGFYRILFNKYKIKDWSIYLADQVLHVISIMAVNVIFKDYSPVIREIPVIMHFMKGSDPFIALRWFLLILCIYKPSNITFIKLFANYRPDFSENPINPEADGIKTERKAGAIIGFLERMLISFFISIKQYSAIGLILTAKSIARYDKIAKDQNFAEYYLIGTLTSVLFALGLYMVIF